MPRDRRPGEARLVVVGDVHFDVRPPRCRRSSYPEEVERKLAEVAALARKLDAQVACTGDFFHRKHPPLEAVERLLRALRAMPGGRVYGVVGNHDAPSRERIAGTGLGLLVEADAVVLLDDGVRVPLACTSAIVSIDGKAVWLTGAHYVPEPGENGRGGVYGRTCPAYAVEVRLTHGMLVPAGERPPFDATPLEQLPMDMPDLLVNGHNHHPFFAEAAHGRRAVWSIGSLARTASDQRHAPRVLVVVADASTRRVSVNPYRLLSALDPEEVILSAAPLERAGKDGVQEADAARERIDAFVDGLEDDDPLAADPGALLDAAGSGSQPAHVARARGYLDAAKHELGE